MAEYCICRIYSSTAFCYSCTHYSHCTIDNNNLPPALSQLCEPERKIYIVRYTNLPYYLTSIDVMLCCILIKKGTCNKNVKIYTSSIANKCNISSNINYLKYSGLHMYYVIDIDLLYISPLCISYYMNILYHIDYKYSAACTFANCRLFRTLEYLPLSINTILACALLKGYNTTNRVVISYSDNMPNTQYKSPLCISNGISNTRNLPKMCGDMPNKRKDMPNKVVKKVQQCCSLL